MEAYLWPWVQPHSCRIGDGAKLRRLRELRQQRDLRGCESSSGSWASSRGAANQAPAEVQRLRELRGPRINRRRPCKLGARIDLPLRYDGESPVGAPERGERRGWRGRPSPCSVTKFKISKKKFRRLHEDSNLDKIKNALRLLSVNGETNLINLIRL